MTILNHFERILSLFGEDGLSESFFETAKENLQTVSELYDITNVQAALLALIMEHEPIEINKLSEIIKCKKIQFYHYMEDLDVLANKRMIKRFSPTTFSRFDSMVYTVPMDFMSTVRKGVGYNNTINENLTPEDFFISAEEIINAVELDDLNFEDCKFELFDLFKKNKQINFVKKSEEYNLNEGSIMVMFIFCSALLNKEDDTIRTGKLCEVFGNREGRRIIKRFGTKEHKLIVNDLVEPICYNGIADAEFYRLTEKAKNEFLSDIDIKVRLKNKGSDVIPSNRIKSKPLFYNKKINESVKELTSILSPENFVIVQKRLIEKGMRNGFACLFSGPPGTGKTETVYQIARETGRDIFQVDISETKSMWFGESERKIKAVFDRYQAMVKFEALAPILLFNEADGVFGKRRELSNDRDGPGQTENAIQNIILQEIENLDGILIATTNMTKNLDKAFERRFLYKIEFDKPDKESKKLMWKNFMPHLNDDDAALLAKKFDFSGGQIENIMRKSTVSFVLKGNDQCLAELDALCEEEFIEKAIAKIGFAV